MPTFHHKLRYISLHLIHIVAKPLYHRYIMVSGSKFLLTVLIDVCKSWDMRVMRDIFVKFLYLAVSCLMLSESSFAAMTVESKIYDMEKVNNVYQQWAKYRDVDVKVLRGDYFYPSEFWKQPIEDVLQYLKLELSRCIIPGMSEPRLNPFPCFPVCPRNELLETELRLEVAICNTIGAFMTERSFEFDRSKYYGSLTRGREKGDLNYNGERQQATPLLTFFKPFSAYYPRWTLEKKR